MKHRMLAALALLVPLCATADGDRLQAARALARDAVLVDTHIDAPTELLAHWADLGRSQPDREFDFPRAREGGLDVAFLSIWTSAAQDEDGTAFEIANRQIDAIEALVQRHPGKFALLRSPRDVDGIVASGRVALPLGMENGAPLGGDLGRIEFFFHRGIRYITLAHSKPNALADASYARESRWRGLSPLGRQAVAEMNRLGIMIDISHLSDAAARQAIELSRVPVLATHSAFRHFTPGFARNLADEEARALAARGGVVQVAFGQVFVDPAAAVRALAYFKARDEHEHRVAALRSAGKPVPEGDFGEAWDKAHPLGPTPISAVLDQIDYGVKLIGIDHVGIGSDFDGVSGKLPEGLRSVADYPNLIAGLMQRGYSDAELRKILGGNVLRVWRAVEEGSEQPPSVDEPSG